MKNITFLASLRPRDLKNRISREKIGLEDGFNVSGGLKIDFSHFRGDQGGGPFAEFDTFHEIWSRKYEY